LRINYFDNLFQNHPENQGEGETRARTSGKYFVNLDCKISVENDPIDGYEG